MYGMLSPPSINAERHLEPSCAHETAIGAIPPGYAAAVWPPSGIDVVATLLLDRGILPGIWIGAALVRRYIGVPFRFERGLT